MSHPFRSPAALAALAAVLLTGAIAGFFYAWVCSTMWGLDAADPQVAIHAMRAMNDSVRNAAFFPAFFLTPVALAIAALLAWRGGISRAATVLSIAALVYLVGGIGVTGLANVPLNEALAAIEIPIDPDRAATVWSEYSGPWQAYNLVRTIASFLAFALAVVGWAHAARGPLGPHPVTRIPET